MFYFLPSRSMQKNISFRIPFAFVFADLGTKRRRTRSMQKNFVPRYHFFRNMRSHKQLFSYRPTTSHFHLKKSTFPSKKVSTEEIFLHRYFSTSSCYSAGLASFIIPDYSSGPASCIIPDYSAGTRPSQPSSRASGPASFPLTSSYGIPAVYSARSCR